MPESYDIHIQKNPIFDPVRGESALVYFPYNPEMVKLIKSIPSAIWQPDFKAWDLRIPMLRVFVRNVKRFQSQLGVTPKWYISKEFSSKTELKCDLRAVKWKTTPFEHQIQGVEYAIKNKRFILGDEPGCIYGDGIVEVTDLENSYSRAVKLSDFQKSWTKDKNVKVKVFVDGRFEFLQPYDVVYSGIKNVMRITLEDNRQITLTLDHKLLTSEGWMEAKDIRRNDLIICDTLFQSDSASVDLPSRCEGIYSLNNSDGDTLFYKFNAIRVTDITHLSDAIPVFDIKFIGPIHNFVVNGIVVHNCGKTKIVLDTVQYLKKFEGLKHCLIICGVNGNKYNWAEETSIHTNMRSHILGSRVAKRTGKINSGSVADTLADLRNLPDAEVLIINVERLRGARVKRKRGQRKTINEFPVVSLIQQHIQNGDISLVAVDESHRCKTPTSAQTQALLWINCPRQIAMTGTLIMNSPLDLYVPFKWMGWETRDYWAFLNRYAIKDNFGSVIGYQNAQELIDVLSCYQLRRLKKDILDLPPKIIHEEYVEMSDNEWKVYNAVKSGLLHLIQGDSVNPDNLKHGLFIQNTVLDPMTLSMRLRQATAHTAIVSDTIKESSKMRRMEEIVEDVIKDGGKCIIFSNWTQVTNIARDILHKYNPAYITGEVTSDQMRNDERLRFQSDDSCKVIIGTIPAMGTGFTLDAANTVIFLDEPWTAAARGQAEDRAHRANTKWNVDIYILMDKDTVDEHVHDVVEGKGDIADLIVDGVVRPEKKAQLMRILIGQDPFRKVR